MSKIIASTVTGVVLQIEAQEGALLAQGDSVLLVESMKMEIPIEAPSPGRLLKLLVAQGDAVATGQAIASFDPTRAAPRRAETP